MDGSIRTIYKNGKIFTSDDQNLYAEAMAVKDGRIEWVGSDAEAESLYKGEPAVDLCGKRVLPGFIDSHMHMIMLANCAKQITILPPLIHSIAELTEEIKRVRAKQGEGKWIQGWGFDEGKLEEHRTPTRYDLDKGCSDSPVMILRTCGHICIANSKALELVGVTRDTPDPTGGKIGKDENGEPNGILYETARAFVTETVPQPTPEDMATAVADLSEVLVSQGITACSDMAELSEMDFLSIFDKAIEKGMKVRCAAYYYWDYVRANPEKYIKPEFMDPSRQVRIAGVKLLGDGSVSGRTAWCDRPYLGGDDCGMPVATGEDYDEAVAYCQAHNCQISTHVMGAKAIDRAIEHTWNVKPWIEGPSPSVRLEHVAMPTEDAIKKAAASGIAFITQPIFMFAEIESYLNNLGPDWTKECYNVVDWLKAGVNMSFSTDSPATAWATPSDPKYCIKGAVTRTAYNGIDCGQANKVDIETAIKLYTAKGAPMIGFNDIGMLKAGYSADFIILDKDMLTIAPEDIDKVFVEKTFIKGELVYSR